jgi:hypothetical protein
MQGQGGGVAQGAADPPKKKERAYFIKSVSCNLFLGKFLYDKRNLYGEKLNQKRFYQTNLNQNLGFST